MYAGYDVLMYTSNTYIFLLIILSANLLQVLNEVIMEQNFVPINKSSILYHVLLYTFKLQYKLKMHTFSFEIQKCTIN